MTSCRTPRAIPPTLAACALAASFLALAFFAPCAHAVGSPMFSSIDLSTGEKPQSKIWYHDGAYWTIVRNASDVAFYELVGSTWRRGTFANTVLASAGNADVKLGRNDTLFVLLYAATPRLFKYTYVPATRAWSLVTGFPVNVPSPSGSETMVLDQDSSGRLWATAEGGGDVNVYYTLTGDHRTWSSAIVLRSGLNPDDITSVIAFGGNKIGVFWSDQARWEFGFRVHNVSDPPATWGAVEVAFSGTNLSDDHINLANDSQGRVYAITKDAFDRMRVHRRAASGGWTTKTDVLGGTGTRGIIQVAEQDAKVYILYTRWGVTPERVEYRVADIEALNFSGQVIFISTTTHMNNVSGMKQPLPKGSVIAVAGTISQAWWNGFGSPPPGPPDGLTAQLQSAPTHVDLAWSAPSGPAPDGYFVYRQSNGGAFTKLNGSMLSGRAFTDPSPPAAAICYRVTAVHGAAEGPPSGSACVDHPPDVVSPATVIVAEGTPLTVVVNASDVDGHAITSLTADLSGLPSGHGATFATNANRTQGTLSWTPSLNAAGSYRVIFAASNALTGLDTTSVIVTRPAAPPGAPSGLAVQLVTLPPPPPRSPARIDLTFNEGAGQSAADASGNNNHGRLGTTTAVDAADPTWIAGVTGGALQFDGTADFVNVADAASLDPPGSFTLEAWVRRISSGGGCVVNKGPSGERTYRLIVSTSGAVEFRWETATETRFEVTVSNAIPDANWHHVACVYDQAANQNRVYVDGVQRGTGAASGLPAANPGPLTLGARFSGSSLIDFFRGAIDDFRITPEVLYTGTFVPPAATAPGHDLLAIAAGTADRNIEAGTNGAPEPAPELLAVPLGARMSLQWLAPTTGGTFTGYHVYRSVNGAAFARLTPTPVTARTYDDANLVEANLCYFVAAINAQAQEGPSSNTACAIVGDAPTHPPVVTAPRTAGGIEGTLLTVQVTASDPEGDPITSLTADLSGLSSGHGATFTTNANHTQGTLIWTPSAAGGPYTVRFTASNALAGTAVTEIVIAQATSNLVGNPSFESGLAGWNAVATGTVLSRVTGGRDGTWAAQVTGPASLALFGINDSPNWVSPALGLGTRYRYSAWVRSASNHGQARIRVREYVAGVQRAESFSPAVALGLLWQQLSLDHVVTVGGASLDFQVLDTPLATGETFYVDQVSIRIVASGATQAATATDAPSSTTPIEDDGPRIASVTIPVSLAIRPVPNPMSAGGAFLIDVPRTGPLRLDLYDAQGRRVRGLIDDREWSAGRATVRWNGSDDTGARAPAGVYHYRLRSAAGDRTGRFVIAR